MTLTLELTDTEWIAWWARHCAPVAIFAYVQSSGVQYAFMPLLREPCEDCGLLH